MLGVVTRVERRSRYYSFTVQDLFQNQSLGDGDLGDQNLKGGISCIFWLETNTYDDNNQTAALSRSSFNVEAPELCDLVKVYGKISTYNKNNKENNQKEYLQLTVHHLQVIQDENEESLWHLQLLEKFLENRNKTDAL